jgi:hypothetical protein
MIEKKAAADRISQMLDVSSWDYTRDDDDPNLFMLEFETSVRPDLRISVITGDEWVYVSHIFGRNPSENQAQIHRRLLEINWILNGCKFAVDEEGDIILLDEQLADDLDQLELQAAIEAIASASEDYYEELKQLGIRA